MIAASVSSSPISVSVSSGSVSVGVSGGSGVSASVSGGIGPQGLTQLSAASDVAFQSVADGNVLRYSNGKWRNHPEEGLVDGGNF